MDAGQPVHSSKTPISILVEIYVYYCNSGHENILMKTLMTNCEGRKGQLTGDPIILGATMGQSERNILKTLPILSANYAANMEVEHHVIDTVHSLRCLRLRA